MTDKENFDLPSDNEYDEALDESFEFNDDDLLEDDADFDAAYDDENWDETGEGLEEEFPQASENNSKPKKSFLSFNTIVMIGAVIVGAFIMVSQLEPKEGDGAKVAPKKFATSLVMQGAYQGPGAIEKEEVSSVEVDPKAEEETKNEGFLFDEGLVDSPDQNVQTITDVPPMPSPIIIENKDGVELDDVGLLDGAEPTSELKPTVDDQLVFDEKQEPAPPVVEDKESLNKQDDVFQEDKPKTDSTSSELLGEMQQDNESINDLKNEAILTPQDDNIESSQQVAPSKVEDSTVEEVSIKNSLDQKFETIISRLETMETKINDLQEINSKKAETLSVEIESLQNKIALLQSATKKETISEEKSKAAPPKTTVKKPSQPKTTQKIAPIEWELRAAQPDKAWVSKKGQKDMQPVVVGDTLSGVGRIQAISFQNGRWTVQGSSGKITQ